MNKLNDKNTYKKILVIITLFILSVMIILAGVFYYKNETDTTLLQKQKELRAVVQLKVNQISEWYKDNFSDSQIIAANLSRNKNFLSFLATSDPEFEDDFSFRFRNLISEHDFETVALLDLNRNVVLIESSRGPSALPETVLKEFIDRSLESRTSIATKLYHKTGKGSEIFISFISPVFSENKTLSGVMIFETPTRALLKEYMSYLPFESETSETYLFKGEGDSVLYLSKPRFSSLEALDFRQSIADTLLPEVRAINGYEGFVTGRDYRGENVYAYVSNIPGTPWYITAKVDNEELFEAFDKEILNIIIITVLFIMITSSGLSYLYGNRQKSIYRKLYEKEKELWQSQEQFKVTIDSLGEGVITADTDGKILYMNEYAEVMTKWPYVDAKGKLIQDVYKLKNEQSGRIESDIVNKVLKDGFVKELANHTLLINKKGDEIPIMDTAAPIYNDERTISGIVITFQDETLKRRQRQLLVESEARYRKTLDNMLEGCQILNYDWVYLYLNDAAASHGKENKKNLLGKKMTEEYPGIEQAEVFKVMQYCMENRVSKKMENKFVFPDGSIGWFDLSFEPVDEGLFVLSIDVTQRKVSERALIESEEKYRELVENIDDIIFMADKDGMLIYLSQGVEKMLHYKPEELIGANYKKLINEDSLAKVEEHMKEAINGEMHPFELSIFTKEGEQKWVRISRAPVEHKGEIIGFRGVISDITEQVKALIQLQIAKDKADELNRIKSHFFANMSHELRTPFVGILGYAELLVSVLENPEHKEMAEGIVRTSKRMKDTLTKILNLSKYEFSGIEISNRAFDITEVLDEVYREYREAAKQKGLIMNKVVEYNSLIIESDQTLLTEIFANLVSNAVIYTNKGEISIYSGIKDNDLVIKISDTGIGIISDKQEVIWEEFRQASEGMTRNFQGTGLGLSIVKKYTSMLGGTITLESEPGKGSVFTILIPLEKLNVTRQ